MIAMRNLRCLPLKIMLSKQGHIQSLQLLFIVIPETNRLQTFFPFFQLEDRIKGNDLWI